MIVRRWRAQRVKESTWRIYVVGFGPVWCVLVNIDRCYVDPDGLQSLLQ